MHIGLNAQLLSSQAGYRSAGIHTYIDRLLRHLPQVAPSSWRFSVMLGKAHRTLGTHYDGVTPIYAPLNTEKPLLRILWEQTVQPVELGAFDLYHAMAFVSPLVMPPNLPSVVTVYDLTFMRYPERLSAARRLYLRMFTARSCRYARRIIAISESTKRDLVELLDLPSSKIDVTPLGYDDAIFRPLPTADVEEFRRRKGLPARFWLFLGTLEPRKNLVMLLKAYAALPPNERLPLILAGGKGWQYDEIFATIEQYQLGDMVHTPGFLPADEMAFWYNSADAFVYPSVFEGFGLPVLEAMACGTPVITTDVSSLPEVAGNAGFCLPPDEIEAWTQALHQAYHDETWRHTARERGLQRARLFNWQYTAELTIKSYRRAMNDDEQQL
ncbi:MAG: glycosyltransferase family 1 protein [Chloroflexi bacterium]|nr:MAG: glycosyltransferase family 1 protein [Chloroflexota bacterium]